MNITSERTQSEARHRVVFGDNLVVLRTLADESVDLIYIDPPFNTGKTQARTFVRTRRDEQGDRTGYQGNRYSTEKIKAERFADTFDDFIAFLKPRIEASRRVLKQTGSLYVHIDYREVHYCKVMIDEIFGRHNFLNEIIWAYDYGARATKRWPAKHDNILFYVKDAKHYYFDNSQVDRIPYMAPGLVSPEKAKRGKLPTDTWWHTIVSPTGKEKFGYPTQKPLGVLDRIVRASCPEGGLLLDFFAGSGTSGDAAARLGHRFLLVDNNPGALSVMRNRFKQLDDILFESLEQQEMPIPPTPQKGFL